MNILRFTDTSYRWWSRWESNPVRSLKRRLLCQLSYKTVVGRAGIEPTPIELKVRCSTSELPTR